MTSRRVKVFWNIQANVMLRREVGSVGRDGMGGGVSFHAGEKGDLLKLVMK